jgi:hypothetical protein
MPQHEKKTIEQVLDEFLDEQEARWGPATFEKYEIVVDLLKAYMENYWPGHDGEQERVRQAGGTFCGTYGAEDIASNFSLFLDYFMTSKGVGSEGTFNAAPRVIKKLDRLSRRLRDGVNTLADWCDPYAP